MRWGTATAFVVGMGTAMYLVPEDWVEHHDAAWTVALLVTYFVCGALVGRWWALVLAFLPVVLAVPLGSQGDADGTPLWWWALIDTGFIFVWVMLAGVLAGWGTRALLRRHRRAGGRNSSVTRLGGT